MRLHGSHSHCRRHRLNGTIPISGAKNAALPLMIASLLTDQRLTLENVPDLADVSALKRILANHGVDYMVTASARAQAERRRDPDPLGREYRRHDSRPTSSSSRMRASFWVIGPLLARMREARVSLPGGCAIGTRPVDFFLMGLENLAQNSTSRPAMSSRRRRADCSAGASVFPHVSVGATHTI